LPVGPDADEVVLAELSKRDDIARCSWRQPRPERSRERMSSAR
jgi:hypothetical protein